LVQPKLLGRHKLDILEADIQQYKTGIRLVLDMLEYNHEIEDFGVILFLNFYKAFDLLSFFYF